MNTYVHFYNLVKLNEVSLVPNLQLHSFLGWREYLLTGVKQITVRDARQHGYTTSNPQN